MLVVGASFQKILPSREIPMSPLWAPFRAVPPPGRADSRSDVGPGHDGPDHSGGPIDGDERSVEPGRDDQVEVMGSSALCDARQACRRPHSQVFHLTGYSAKTALQAAFVCPRYAVPQGVLMRESGCRPGLPGSRRRRHRYFLGVSAYTFTYAEGFSYLSDDPKACINCHIMNDQYHSWSSSSHHSRNL